MSLQLQCLPVKWIFGNGALMKKTGKIVLDQPVIDFRRAP